MAGYREAIAREIARYEHCLDVHELPEIFHYWSKKHLGPKLERFGFSSPNDFFAKSLIGSLHPGVASRIVSFGSGNCDLEADLARRLRSAGLHEFIFECVDLNPAMLDRGAVLVREAGLADHFAFTQADLNSWRGSEEYDAAIANHSLHHVLDLEGLFDEIRRTLKPSGRFIVADMIGRNGHRRWPEALEVVHEFWRRLPPSYRFNRLLGGYEPLFEDWDCSNEGFEGIRSQDILPLLNRLFHFTLFVPYSNAIDPFIDRAFGPNFDADQAWDRAFIDELHERDEREIVSGRLTPTHMFAVLGHKDDGGRQIFSDHPSPGFCIRDPGLPNSPSDPDADRSPYDCKFFPDGLTAELERLGCALNKAGEPVRARTEWALSLKRELDRYTILTADLQAQFDERTRWALALESELREQQAYWAKLRQEFEDRTNWALRLDRELEENTALAERLLADRESLVAESARLRDLTVQMAEERNGLIRNPLRYFRAVCGAAVRALKAPRDGSRQSAGR